MFQLRQVGTLVENIGSSMKSIPTHFVKKSKATPEIPLPLISYQMVMNLSNKYLIG
jgi:hypothetical protein